MCYNKNMGFLDSILEGVKNTLKWKVQSGVTGGLEKGIGAVVKGFKGKDKCPSCKEPITEMDAKFCPHCRAALVLVCPNQDCKRESPINTKFCPSCGTELPKTGK